MRPIYWLAMLVLAAAQGQERQPGQGVNFYSKDKEIALGRQMAEAFHQKTKRMDNTALAEYVNQLGASLASQFPGAWTYDLEIIRQDTEGTIHEPEAFPGGPIFIPVDLIRAARNEAEFAGMLAHAMAHVEARHWTRLASRDEVSQMAVRDVSVQRPDLSVDVALRAGRLTFERAYEREADYLAVKAMVAAGYDPAGLASYLERVQPPPGANRTLETLPARDQRVAAIQDAIRRLPARTYRADDEFAHAKAAIGPAK